MVLLGSNRYFYGKWTLSGSYDCVQRIRVLGTKWKEKKKKKKKIKPMNIVTLGDDMIWKIINVSDFWDNGHLKDVWYLMQMVLIICVFFFWRLLIMESRRYPGDWLIFFFR